MSNKDKKRESLIDLEEIAETFSEDLLLKDLDKYTLLKLIIHCLSQCIEDKDGNKPQFTLNQNFVFIEIEDLRYTIEVRDNNKYT